MRVIAGKCKGRVLYRPRNQLIRPTSDKVKKFIFDYIGQQIQNATILDLFSGAGSLAIEASSRGARFAVLVDKSREAIRLIYRNLELTRLLPQCQIIHQDVFRYLKIAANNNDQFDFIFADPPYAMDMYGAILENIGAFNLLQDEGLLILEHSSHHNIDKIESALTFETTKIFGDTAITFYYKKGS